MSANMDTPASTLGRAWNQHDIRRSLRVLGAQQSRAGDLSGCVQALRLVRGMLERRGVATELFQDHGLMPLLVAGDGPVLLVSYLDDPHVPLNNASLPRIAGETVSGEGITRKAGVLAACGALLHAHAAGGGAPFTLAVEVDRHAGSGALEAWLRLSGRRFDAALWEVVDLPISVPALFRAAFGVARVRVRAHAHSRRVENLYAGVLPDAGHVLAAALSALKSTDLEVLLPSFYDDVQPPSSAELRDVHAVADRISGWLAGAVQSEGGGLSANHLSLGVFCAPSLFVRDLEMHDAGSFMSGTATATIEARIMPGQTPVAVTRAITDFMQRRLPGTEVEPLCMCQPAQGTLIDAAGLGDGLAILPIAPGDSPAGMLEGFGARTGGYAIVGREPGGELERVALPAISAGATLLRALGAAVAIVERSSRQLP